MYLNEMFVSGWILMFQANFQPDGKDSLLIKKIICGSVFLILLFFSLFFPFRKISFFCKSSVELKEQVCDEQVRLYVPRRHSEYKSSLRY